MKKRIELTKQEKKKRRHTRILAALLSVFLLLSSLYALFVYSDIGFIKFWRTIWIETAMTTKTHQWLATWFIPQDIIDDVMSQKADDSNVTGGMSHLGTKDEKYPVNVDERPLNNNKDILGQKGLREGDLDYCGNEIVINDIEQGILVSKIEGYSAGFTYRGRIMLVDDPSRVYIGMTKYPGEMGMRILEMMDYYGAVAGVNASGFYDPNDNGNGGVVVGMSCSQGQYWGSYVQYYGSMVLTTDDKLVVGHLADWKTYGNIRDGMQFSPVLIADGIKQVEGSAGYGMQPRTGVGQREDGVMVFLNIDGRDPSYSMGCTVGDMADILSDYGVVNACACDSGATSVIAYKGEVITQNCSLHPDLGRILPNAFLIAPKK